MDAPLFLRIQIFEDERLDEIPRQIIFNVRENPWVLPDSKFIKLFRLNKELVHQLVAIIEPRLPRVKRQSAIPSDIKVLVALRFFATGCYQLNVAQDKVLNVSQKSVSVCIHQVCHAMEGVLGNWIQFPQSEEDIQRVKQRFWQKYKFPGVIGAIDGTHVAIVAPPRDDPVHPEHAYINWKGFHSINVQIIADADQQILSIWPKFPGRTHDSYVWRRSGVRAMLVNKFDAGMRNTWLLGDSGYPLEPFLMTPILDAMANTPDGKYTDRQCLTRSIVESTIGLLKARWRCLLKQRTLHYHPPTASKIINTCAALHNMCVRNNVPLLEEEDVEDMEQGFENFPFGDADNARRGRERAIGLQIQRRLIINHFTG